MPTQPNRVELTRTDQRTKTTSNPHQNGRHYFKYAGRQWRLFKRSKKPDAFWYIEFERKGQIPPRQLRSLDTSSKAHAEAEAKSYIDAWLQHRRDERSGLAPRATVNTYATIGEMATVLPQLTIKASAKTRADYLANLHRCLVPALGIARDAVLSVRLDALTDTAAAKFFAWVETEATKLPSQAERHRFRGSWVSMFTTANALFAPRAEYQFTKTFGLKFPDLKHWRNAAKIHGPQLPRESGPAIPDDSILRRTLIEWLKIGRQPGYVCRNRSHRVRENGQTSFVAGPLSEIDRKNFFLSVGLELSCGLRKSEVPRVCWGWHKVFSGVPHLSSRETQTKNATGEIHIVPLDPFYKIMMRIAARNGWIGKPDEPMLTARTKTAGDHGKLVFSHGGLSDSRYWPFTHVGWFLRDLGFETTKTNHSLRDYGASLITMRYSIADASDWCRHSSITTTEAHYSRFTSMAKRVSPLKLRWIRWASIKQS